MKFGLEDYDFSNNSDATNIDHLLYRFGYIANIGIEPKLSDRLSDRLKHWVLYQQNTLYVKAHPEVPVTIASSKHSHVVIIGHVFDALNKQFDSEAIARKLSSYSQESNAFLDELDGLAGRYVVYVNFGAGWTVYPDAFSSKMRYFSPQHPGMVASHTTLIADSCGAQLDFDMFAFMTSNEYRKRDVKNLPGLLTEYEDIFVAPANQALDLTRMQLNRFWPRHNIRHDDVDLAKDVFISYLDGYSDYVASTFEKDIFGLTGGMDSRTMLAPLLAKNINVQAFTLLRGSKDNREDLETAKLLAEKFGFSHTIIDVSTEEAKTSGYYSEIRKLLRIVGGPQRLNTIYSNEMYYRKFHESAENSNFSRGFGGEIIRGFFQRQGNPLKQATAAKFAGLMGIHGEHNLTKQCFQHFIDNLQYDRCFDADLFDIYYMEHRMSKWGANALSETDITAHTMVGMNCRKLYEVNIGLPLDLRKTREVFKSSIKHFLPELLCVDVC